MKRTAHNRVWLEIDLSVLQDNYRKMVAAVAPSSVMAVLKANAYGLGVRRVAGALVDAGCSCFGVAELNEALELRKLGCSVQILGGLLADEIDAAVEAGVVLPVTDLETARRISAVATEQAESVKCQFLVDTGMGRLGIPLDNAVAIIREAVSLPRLECDGIYSHFPIAYHDGGEYTNRQIDDFVKLLEELQSESISFRLRHIANSDAINNFPRSFAPPFNAVRSGINLHGCFDLQGP